MEKPTSTSSFNHKEEEGQQQEDPTDENAKGHYGSESGKIMYMMPPPYAHE